MSGFDKVERVLAAVLSLLIFALNEVRMFELFPRAPSPGDGRVHALAMRIGELEGAVFVSTFDLAIRWGLAGVTFAFCLWALAETFQKTPAPATPLNRH